MPSVGVSGRAAQRFFEPGFRPRKLSPARRAHAAALRSRRIERSHFRSTIIGAQGFFVAVSELVDVTELDPWDRAFRPEKFSQPFGLHTRCVEFPDTAVQAY